MNIHLRAAINGDNNTTVTDMNSAGAIGCGYIIKNKVKLEKLHLT